MPVIDLVGQTFGRWTVIKRVENKNGRDAKFLCQCQCGTQKEVLGKNLRNGRSQSCGCYHKEISSQQMIARNKASVLDLRNQKYGLLTPLEPTERRLSSSVVWKCLCDCGNITYVSADNLRGSRPVRSCGCIGSSVGERVISDLLKSNNIQFKKEYIFNDLVYEKTQAHPRYDFYLPEYNRLIEFDGEHHYQDKKRGEESLEEIQKRDLIKNNYAKEHNIPLVRIPYWERDNITLEMIMGDQYLVK